MGVTIFYKGKLNHPGQAGEFIDEMEDISKAMEWEYKIFNKAADSGETALQGIVVHPHKDAESLMFFFDNSGCLRNIVMMNHAEDQTGHSYINFIKTQFAPVEIHIVLVKLFRYIEKKYITNLEITDEGGYWETGDAGILKQRIDFLNSKIEEVGVLLNSVEIQEGEPPESIADKIEQIISKKLLKKCPPKE